MRPLSVLTLAASLVLVCPMIVWSLGLAPPTWMWEIHLLAIGLALRILFMAGALSGRAREMLWVGGFSGILSSICGQLLLHSPHDRANLAASFLSYGPLGAKLYQLDEIVHWWPYAISVGNGFLYAGIGLAIFRIVQTRYQPWSLERNRGPVVNPSGQI